tara:strand:- start:2124 stop:5588 length:3465 start_codon:yes stop_codon:yes gene_type:complete
MKIRLVAYRKATSSATSETTYQLDLQEAPNISLNYQFSDIKDPATRKGGFSQTFKLPFTDNNNQFFQDWYNVNLETLVFTTRKKFDATLFVGTVPQFEGSLQLKAVYQKAQVYEVVLMSTASTLFSVIGEQRLKDVFLEESGSYIASFNHVYDETTLAKSWGNTLTNAAGGSLYDSDSSVSKIVYPLSVTRDKFYYDPNDTNGVVSNIKRYLRMDQSFASAWNAGGGNLAYSYSVPITQFRPAVQIRAILRLLLGRAGFTYTSTFIDSDPFNKIFMTTANHIEVPVVPTVNANPSGFSVVGNSSQWGAYYFTSGESQTFYATYSPDMNTPSASCTVPNDPDSIWDLTNNTFEKKDVTMYQLRLKTIMRGYNVSMPTLGSLGIRVRAKMYLVIDGNVDYNQSVDTITTYLSQYGGDTFSELLDFTFDISEMPVGAKALISIRVNSFTGWDQDASSSLILGYYTDLSNDYDLACGNSYSSARIDWIGYSTTNIFNKTVDFPSCIDPEITQKAFLKDIIQRFNLVVVPDPNDPNNLLIEPYNDFIASGNIQYWTDKLDTSKEVVVKDTTEMQKKTIHLTDQEDEDLYNKSIRERYPAVNVYSHLKQQNSTNDFATGEFTVDTIFSPFINGQVFASENEELGTFLPNMAVHYERSYETNDGVSTISIAKTKPKLFYYPGSATTVKDLDGATQTYYLHNTASGTTTAYSFTTYPKCTPYVLTNSNTSSLDSTTNSLHWNSTPPLVGNLSVFQYGYDYGNWYNNTLYGKYWKSYLDNIYSQDARIMECYLNLNEVDIYNFSFKDEIFIKDSYWRLLKIENYQVNAQASTKVTLIKVLDTFETAEDCNYVLGFIGTSNLLSNQYFMWCPDTDPGCEPLITGTGLGIYANPSCCINNGGEIAWQYTAYADDGLYPCLANSGSLPVRLKSIYTSRSILQTGTTKTFISNIIGGLNRALVRGVDNTKYSQRILPDVGDDIVIKYKNLTLGGEANIRGESHRIVLSGMTTGNTTGYAYPGGDKQATPLFMPDDSNIIVRVKGVGTVVGGTSTTYPVGASEGVAYYTAFIISNGTATQLSTAGGVQEFNLRGAVSQACTLYIDMNEGALRFGLNDSQTDTIRTWVLTADIDVNEIPSLSLPYDENWALYQNGILIELQNGDFLIWN